MKKKIRVSNTHRYTKEKTIQFYGYAEAEYNEDRIIYEYREKDNTKVRLYIYESFMQLERFAQMKTLLTFKKEELTLNPIKSPYGIFEIEIYTHDYLNERNYIRVEYDVENGTDDKDGFIIEIEEGRHEFH